MKMVTLDDPLLERLSPEQRTQVGEVLRNGAVLLLGDGHVLVGQEIAKTFGPTVPENLQRLIATLDRSAFTLPALPDPHMEVARMVAWPANAVSSAGPFIRQRRSCRTNAQRKARAKAKAAKQARKKQRGKR
jgi:hypothetical protein